MSVLCSCDKSNPADPNPTPETPIDIAPNAPSSLAIQSMMDTEVKLQWMDNSTSELSFDIEIGIDSLNFTVVKTVPANVDTASIAGTFLTTETYYFRVKAKTPTKTSNASNVVHRSIFPAPTNFQITSMTGSVVSLSWTDNSNTETSFDIEQSTDNDAFIVARTVGSNINSSTITASFDSNKTYAFRVCGRIGGNRSAYSNTLSRTPGMWVLVGGGSFYMGRSGGFRDEQPIHLVTLKSYYISKCEVTVQKYREYTTATKRSFPPMPAWGWNDNDPIVNLTWNDANSYCIWLSDTTKKTVRLCTEAEWEFAARGGKFSQGFSYSGSDTLENVGWCFANASSRVHTVGMKLPNELGIYDMSGNAWEWCSDWYGSYSYQMQTNPTGPGGGSSKIFRGGSWFDYGLGASDCRVETRYTYTINSRTEDGGFRIVKEL